MAFTFVHTADWQIGARLAWLGRAAAEVRAARFTAAERVVAVANERRADLLLVAGDVFEDPDVPRADVGRTVDVLRASAAPVLVLPGNHDPLVPKGPYDHPAWRDAAPHVRVCRDAAPVAVGDADVLPCPVFARTSSRDPLEALPDRPAGPATRLRIGLAHGSLLGATGADAEMSDDFPVDRSHVRRAGLDYLALGHWHRPSAHDVDGVARIFYSGSHEPTAVDEVSEDGLRRSGECLVASLDAPGAAPRVEAVRTAVFDWRKEVVALASAEDVAAFRARIDAEPAASRRLGIRAFELTGVVPVGAAAALRDLEDLARARFFVARMKTDAIRFLPTDDAWVTALPAGAPQEAARVLLAEAAGEGRPAETARRALRLLFEIAETSA